MNMKKLVMIGLVIVCAVIAFVTVSSEKKEAIEAMEAAQGQETFRAEGLIATVEENNFIIQDATLGELRVNYDATTVFEGVDAAALAFGQYVFVDFDGKMTRSIPPQISGMKVGMYPVSGVVTEVSESSVTIEQNNGNGQAVIHLLDGAPELAIGDEIIAYTNGAMTMSIPPQTTALAVEFVAAAE
ncbi:MAG: hypothetical protein IKU34_01755 [Clostridia bacterium]|nr:hypothetical protein [Clostridia bacterium]